MRRSFEVVRKWLMAVLLQCCAHPPPMTEELSQPHHASPCFFSRPHSESVLLRLPRLLLLRLPRLLLPRLLLLRLPSQVTAEAAVFTAVKKKKTRRRFDRVIYFYEDDDEEEINCRGMSTALVSDILATCEASKSSSQRLCLCCAEAP